jgi:hypothetical protein
MTLGGGVAVAGTTTRTLPVRASTAAIVARFSRRKWAIIGSVGCSAGGASLVSPPLLSTVTPAAFARGTARGRNGERYSPSGASGT